MDRFETYRLHVVIIGDSMCGKSMLFQSFANDLLVDATEPTIGVDFFSKTIELEDGKRVRFHLWDTAGQEKYRSLTKSYYRKAMGVFLAYDVTCRWSFLRLNNWLQEAKIIICNNVVYQVIGCKCDLESQREVSTEEGEAFAREHGMGFFETSAKKRHNVNEAFAKIAGQILKKVEIGKIEATKITPDNPLVTTAQKLKKPRTKKKGCQVCMSV